MCRATYSLNITIGVYVQSAFMLEACIGHSSGGDSVIDLETACTSTSFGHVCFSLLFDIYGRIESLEDWRSGLGDSRKLA